MLLSASVLPTVNAMLNAASTVLVLGGLWCVKTGRVAAHKVCMGLALATSALFLVSYLTYHAKVGSVHFQGIGWMRPVYFAILISHTVLAAVILPLALRTAWLALRNRIDAHRAIARWTAPIWLYVSVTGVVVYWMLYRT